MQETTVDQFEFGCLNYNYFERFDRGRVATRNKSSHSEPEQHTSIV